MRILRFGKTAPSGGEPRRGTRFGARLLTLAAVGSVSFLSGAPSGFAATPGTPYDTVGLVSPDPTQQSGRWPERLADPGDLTGDGVRDVFASSYLMDVAGIQNAGKVTLVSGGDRTIRYELVSPEIQGDPGGNFGFYISVPGDVNGDAKDDLVVGAPYQDVYTGSGSGCGTPEPNGCNENQGKAYVYSGPTGKLLYTLDNPEPQSDEGVFATFGARIGTAGDLTGDGRTEFIVGSPANDVPANCAQQSPVPAGCRKNEGSAYVFNGATGALLRTYRIPAADRQEPSCTTASSTARCGHLSVPQSPGDVNRDGVPDHYISAYGLRRPNIVTPQFFGRIYLFSGATGAVLTRIDQPAPDANAFWGLQDVVPNTPGDVSGDGAPDLYGTGFQQDGPNGENSAGRAWVFDGAASVAAGTGVVLYEVRDPAPAASKAFGWSASRTDYNKDGRPDLFVSNLSSLNTAVNLYDGRNGSHLRTLSLPASEAQPNVPGNGGNALGWSSRAPGDLNRDGEPDYVATGHGTDVGGVQDVGKLYFFLSRASRGGGAGGGSGGGRPTYPGPGAGSAAFPGCPALTANVIRGTAAGNAITGTPRADRIFAGTGNDVVDALAGDDCVDLGPGTDRGQGGLGRDLMLGGLGADRMAGSSGNDRLRGGASADRLIGGFGNDNLHGQSGSDRLGGERGRDRINGGSAGDVISGGSSGDRVAGDQGGDRITGNSGNDSISGNSGRDRLKGASGRDRLSGGSGGDRISARDGQRDRVSCGRGRDTVTVDRSDRVARDCERVRRR